MSSYTFNWPAGPKEVIVTGTFDNWSKSHHLVKQTDGSFELTVPFAEDSEVLYKYVVDGEWLINPAQSIGRDSNGIENNIFTSDHLFSAEVQSRIPEAGGLAVMPGSLTTTVMASTEGQQTTLGEPGIFIPKDKESLDAFRTYENTDRNVNEEAENAKTDDTSAPKVSAVAAVLTPAELKKQKKTLKRTKHKLNKKGKDAKSFAAASVVSSTDASLKREENPSKGAVLASGAAGLGAAKEAYGSSEDHLGSHTATSAAETEQKSGVPTQSELKETMSKTPAFEEDKEPAPYALTEKDHMDEETGPASYALNEKDLVQLEMAPDCKSAGSAESTESQKMDEETRNTLDPTVIGVVGGAAGVGALASSHDSETLKWPNDVTGEICAERDVYPSIQPAIVEPSVPPESMSPSEGSESPVQLAPVSNHAKEVTALPVSGERIESQEEIIITQGGNVKEIEQQIAAAEIGPVSVEEFQPTVSEAKKMADEAHIPVDEIKTAPMASKQESSASSSGKNFSSGSKSSKSEGKEKKKGFFSKLKKMFK